MSLHARRGFRPTLESVEVRLLLSTFVVANLNNSGSGSLRQALLDADATTSTGPDLIDFTVAGTIRLASGALPAISRPVDVDGTSAPGFDGTPVVQVDADGFAGLKLAKGSGGSTVRSIGLIGAGSDGITLDAPDITVSGDFIGVELGGSAVDGNRGDGLVIDPSSSGDVIGATSTGGAVISLASNVISGNGGDGVVIRGSHGNQLIANYIGTDVTGTQALANGANGVLLDQGSHGNTIGGTVAFVNSSDEVPLSNLISGNHGDGVLITGRSSANLLGSNFIGTDDTGDSALGNGLDGVAILGGSDRNVLTGTTITDQPFIYANIVGGNGGNGIRVDDSNNTVIQANFFGLGYDNKTPVPNALDGALFEGTSANTQFGGVIPLGNVSAANGGNGLEIRDKVSGTVAFNTFCGLAAFEDYSNLGNGRDGMLITSTGGNNTIRTNVVANNRDDGIEIGGQATGVHVTEDIIGLNTNGSLALPNGEDGILVDGNAHGNTIGGFQQSVIPQVTVSANLGDGVAITGTAHENTVIRSFIGTDIFGRVALGNGGDGIFVGRGTYANRIGGSSTDLGNVIGGNSGSGIELSGTRSDIIAGNLIGAQAAGRVVTAPLPLPNGGDGVVIEGSTDNLIGGKASGAGNTIAFNDAAGVSVDSGSGNAVLRDSIAENQGDGIVLRAGANDNQAAPILTQARIISRGTVLSGRLNSTPGTTFRIEFFASRPLASGGQAYLGSSTVATNAGGVALFAFLAPDQPDGASFTATATGPSFSTSTFSDPIR